MPEIGASGREMPAFVGRGHRAPQPCRAPPGLRMARGVGPLNVPSPKPARGHHRTRTDMKLTALPGRVSAGTGASERLLHFDVWPGLDIYTAAMNLHAAIRDLTVGALLCCFGAGAYALDRGAGDSLATNFRRPTNDADLRYWLENMAVFHRFTAGEISLATGLTLDEVATALRRFELAGRTAPRPAPGQPLRVLPYPGGRHPRLGFLEGAVMPQRETKVSVFTPWDEAGYVVVDVPEAIFSNLGLTYLAHTHIPTIWDQTGVTLPHLEWQRRPDGTLESERTLPNGIAFGASVRSAPTEVRMHLWLRNGTKARLTGLRVQNCVMLGYAPGFNAQTNANKVFQSPYAAVRSDDGRRWITTAWDPAQRCWGNEQCPCLHSDPQFPDCEPGETQRLRGWLSFYEGRDLEAEFKRIEATGWRK